MVLDASAPEHRITACFVTAVKPVRKTCAAIRKKTISVTKKITYNHGEIFYHVYGEGSPVILLHGFGETSSVWHKQIDALQNSYRLIMPDLPGSGQSTMLNMEVDHVSLGDFAGCVNSILEYENIRQCVMLGHSMGGYIMLAFAEEYPEKLKAFGFLHSTAFADSDEKKQVRLRGIEMMENYGSYAFLKSTVPNLFAPDFKTVYPEEIDQLIEDGKQFSKKSLQQYYYAMMQRPDRTHVLKNSKVPVLFMLGTQDVAAPLSDLLKQVHLPRISYIHILNTGHMGMWEASGGFNEYLEEFVNESV